MSTLVKKEKSAELSAAVVAASLQDKAKPHFNKLKKIDEIKTQEDFNIAGEQIKVLKAIAKEAKEEENKMTSKLDEVIEMIKGHFEPFRTKVQQLDTDIKLKMSIFLQKNKDKLANVNKKLEIGSISVGTYAKNVANLQVKNGAAKVKKVWTLEILDAKKIPREYLVPDEAAIRQAFKEGKKVPGCSWEQKDSIAI